MYYQEFSPSARVASSVATYWLFSSAFQTKSQRILPDGCADIILNLGESVTGIPKHTIALSGMMTRHSEAIFDGGTMLLGIRFKAGQLSSLVPCALSEFTDQTVDMADIDPNFNRKMLDRLIGRFSLPTSLATLEDLLLSQYSSSEKAVDPLITSVTDYLLLRSSEKIDIRQLAKRHAVSIRQLERRFKATVGVTPKDFHCISRFQQAMVSLTSHPDTSLLQFAFDHGYYDHVHLTNEIKRFSGQAPSSFR